MRQLAVYLFSLCLLTSCEDGKSGSTTLPSMTGGLNEVVIVLDEHLWQGQSGDSLRTTLGAEVPGIPWQEPLFDLVQIPKKAFSRIFKTHRNLVLFEKGTKTDVGFQHDLYAKGQLVTLITYSNPSDLSQLLQQYAPIIAYRFQEIEKDRQQAKMPLQKGLDTVFNKHGFSLSVPKDFHLALDTGMFTWLEYSPIDKGIIQGIFMYEMSGDFEFHTWGLLAERDRRLQQYVPGRVSGSYMITDRLITPWVKHTESMGYPALEIKGVWKMENDFMGGPFIAHYLHDSIRQKVIAIEGFLFNPGYNKRDHMQQLQLVLESAKKLPQVTK
tara:strand:+ start:300 stop:1280 length:981 start_codon:yes stop_codon:yes gene_type:complete